MAPSKNSSSSNDAATAAKKSIKQPLVTGGAAETTKPKRELSPYIKYCKEQRPQIIQKDPKATFGEIGKMLGEQWKNMSAKDKEKYGAVPKIVTDVTKET